LSGQGTSIHAMQLLPTLYQEDFFHKMFHYEPNVVPWNDLQGTMRNSTLHSTSGVEKD
jgi:hypothetical protein